MDLLKRRQVSGTELVPLPQIEDAEDESDEERRKSPREAQQTSRMGWPPEPVDSPSSECE